MAYINEENVDLSQYDEIVVIIDTNLFINYKFNLKNNIFEKIEKLNHYLPVKIILPCTILNEIIHKFNKEKKNIKKSISNYSNTFFKSTNSHALKLSIDSIDYEKEILEKNIIDIYEESKSVLRNAILHSINEKAPSSPKNDQTFDCILAFSFIEIYKKNSKNKRLCIFYSNDKAFFNKTNLNFKNDLLDYMKEETKNDYLTYNNTTKLLHFFNNILKIKIEENQSQEIALRASINNNNIVPDNLYGILEQKVNDEIESSIQYYIMNNLNYDFEGDYQIDEIKMIHETEYVFEVDKNLEYINLRKTQEFESRFIAYCSENIMYSRSEKTRIDIPHILYFEVSFTIELDISATINDYQIENENINIEVVDIIADEYKEMDVETW